MRTWKKATVGLMALSVAAAGSLASVGAVAAQDDALVVGISWNNFAQPRWANQDQPAIKAAVEAAGGTVIERDANDSNEQQLADVASLIEEGADVLIVLAKDTVAILPAIQAAKDAGVPVIGYDRLIEDSDVVYLTFDNVGVGTVMAKVITEAQPTGNYVIIKGHAADPNATFLREGMDEYLLPLVESGDITIVWEDFTDNWDTTNARNNMDAALAAADNDVQAVISENDSMATGVVAALADVGLDGTVPVTGQDGDTAALQRVAAGTQLVSVLKDSFALGKAAGDIAVQLAQGVAPADVTSGEVAAHAAPALGEAAQPFTTPGGIDVPAIVLTPTPVTQDNLNVPVEIGWITAEELCANAEAGSVAPC